MVLYFSDKVREALYRQQCPLEQDFIDDTVLLRIKESGILSGSPTGKNF